MQILKPSSSSIRFDSKSLVDDVTPFDTVEDIVLAIEKRSGKKFQNKLIHASVVQMVGNIFNFFDYSKSGLSNDLVRASIYAKRMEK